MRIGCVLLTATAALGLAGVSGRLARADDNRDGYRRYPGYPPRDRYERGSRDDSSASGRSDFDDEGYAVEPYWAYPPEYYIFSRHPSRYYYTFPDRYYSRRPRDRWRWYDRGRADREDNYGYRGPYGPYPEYRWDDQDRDYRDRDNRDRDDRDRDDRDRDYRDYRDYRDRMYRQRDGYRQRYRDRGGRDHRRNGW